MKLNEKIKHLNEYLKANYKVELHDILSLDKDTFVTLTNENKLTQDQLKKISGIFYLNYEDLINEEIELPHDDHLKVDELLIKINQGNYINTLGKNSNKHVIKRNFLLLSKPLKKRLIGNVIIALVPFLFIVIYALTSSLVNVSETLSSYKQGDSLTSDQLVLKQEMEKQANDKYANVKVGVTLENISSISSSTSSFNATLSTYFDFDQKEYFLMYYYKVKGEDFNKDNFYTTEDYLEDNFCFDSTNTSYLPYKDNIPDILQFNFADNTHMGKTNYPTSVSTIYQECLKAYPGEKSSNIYTDKNDEFRIGNGKLTSDSLEYQDRGSAYYDETTKSYRYYQKVHYSATITKTFDSPRYPLDSAQFKIYIQPTRSSQYVRYIADETSGYSTYFSIGNGYRLIKESNNIKNFNVKLNYYKEKDVDHSSKTYGQEIIKTQLEVIVRANKHGISVYLNSFLNIIAVAIWLTLAFYNQSFNKDDSMSMIGTGFFSAISAILLGLSTVGSANTDSLLTYVNIFTLLMVLVIGFESIKAKRYSKIQDASMIAYSNCKMRILFYAISFCALLIYILVPAISYIWIL
jgi:hypothetical protein